jgi:hypothetical protein
MQFNLSEWAPAPLLRRVLRSCCGRGRLYSRLGATRIRHSRSGQWWCRPPLARRIEETLDQVTERIERTLKETPRLDFLRSFTRAGSTTIFVNLKGSTPPSEVPDIWYHVRKSIGDMRHTLPAGVVGPGFNDEFGDTFGIIYGFTADGFTHRELRDYVENIRTRLLRVADVSKIEILGAQDETIIIEFSTDTLAGLGIDRAELVAALRAQNAVSPAGTLQTGDEKLALRVSGAFQSELDILAVNFASHGRLIRLRIAESGEPMSSLRNPCSSKGSRPSASRAMRGRRHSFSRAQRARTMDEIGRPAARHRDRARGQSVVRGPRRHRRVHDVALAGNCHHHGGERREPGRARRRHRRALDTAHARDGVPDHELREHRSPAHLARRAHHRADFARR